MKMCIFFKMPHSCRDPDSFPTIAHPVSYCLSFQAATKACSSMPPTNSCSLSFLLASHSSVSLLARSTAPLSSLSRAVSTNSMDFLPSPFQSSSSTAVLPSSSISFSGMSSVAVGCFRRLLGSCWCRLRSFDGLL